MTLNKEKYFVFFCWPSCSRQTAVVSVDRLLWKERVRSNLHLLVKTLDPWMIFIFSHPTLNILPIIFLQIFWKTLRPGIWFSFSWAYKLVSPKVKVGTISAPVEIATFIKPFRLLSISFVVFASDKRASAAPPIQS